MSTTTSAAASSTTAADASDQQQRRRRAFAPVVIALAFSLSLCLARAVASTPEATAHLTYLVLFDFLIQTVGWAWSAWFASERYFDATGSLTYIALTLCALVPALLAPIHYAVNVWLPPFVHTLLVADADAMAFSRSITSLSSSLVQRGLVEWRALLVSAFVLVWAARLGTFLLTRIAQEGGRDKRFNDIRDDPVRLASVWSLQGLWVFVVGSGAFSAVTNVWSSTSKSVSAPSVVEWVGIAMWLVGFTFEVVADEQKRCFRHDASKHGQFIQSGLWYYSRHPNYFGEILLWTGVFLFNLPTLHAYQYWTVLSPCLTATLLLFVSGVPMLEANNNKKWGDNAAYKQYKAVTPLLIPNPLKA